MQEKAIVISEIRRDGKLLFQLGILDDEQMIIIKRKGYKKRYYISLDEIFDNFKK